MRLYRREFRFYRLTCGLTSYLMHLLPKYFHLRTKTLSMLQMRFTTGKKNTAPHQILSYSLETAITETLVTSLSFRDRRRLQLWLSQMQFTDMPSRWIILATLNC